jgi:hypothetical protein
VTLVLTALIAAAASVLVAFMSASPIRRRLDDCERDRRQTKQLLQLFIGALVGVVPETARLKLLEAATEMSTHDEAA